MKRRSTILTLTACLFSSLALADNPSDAPLLPSDATATVAQQQTYTAYSRRQPKKKNESRAPETANDNSPKNNHPEEQIIAEYPAAANN